ncbi:protein SAWADEE HOMEODOMAIN HOMOLOG 2-like [Arachis stenosperma]|uniref:protein SAWADEE HOMEODOMAIN HOMOLOG 2-like n=1 Tax=Arachis stenosperma TaxID=217475 RepID=UPI0025ACBDFB|nr:protein SAWADEE HOMEODOMAIN HOMOLOG 2-like [Arachis stenosperma]
MGRPPSNGGPAFRFTSSEVAEMEAILHEHNNAMPARDVLAAIAEKFSESPGRCKDKITVQMRQVWNWFQNKRYAIRAKLNKSLVKLDITPMTKASSAVVKNIHQPTAATIPTASGKVTQESSATEFEAKSGRDRAWYDVANFIMHRYLESGDPEVLVRFSGFGPAEDEWVNVRKNVRPRSLPCESAECVAVLPGDLILCFQEGKEQALYFDAHVLDAQRRRHDVRGCRCRFLVRYDHDQSEEIVQLRKICRRPETDFRLQQLHAVPEMKSGIDPAPVHAVRVATSAESQKQQNANTPMSTLAQSISKVETSSDVTAGSVFPVSAATFATNVASSSVHGASSHSMAEGK